MSETPAHYTVGKIVYVPFRRRPVTLDGNQEGAKSEKNGKLANVFEMPNQKAAPK
jgi:hypothetical protein